MIKYKVIEVSGNKRGIISEIGSREFDNIDSARKNFDSVDVYQEILKDYSECSELCKQLLIEQKAFLEYDLVEYDTDNDEFYKILGKKSSSFKTIFR